MLTTGPNQNIQRPNAMKFGISESGAWFWWVSFFWMASSTNSSGTGGTSDDSQDLEQENALSQLCIEDAEDSGPTNIDLVDTKLYLGTSLTIHSSPHCGHKPHIYSMQLTWQPELGELHVSWNEKPL